MNHQRFVIKNGRLWDGERFLNGDIAVSEGKIAAIGRIPEDFSAMHIYDAQNDIVSCGLVDIHVHLKHVSSGDFEAPGESVCYHFGVTAAADGSAVAKNDYVRYTDLGMVFFVPVTYRNNKASFELVEEQRAFYGERVVGVKAYFDQEISEVRDITPFRETCEYAHAHGLRVMVHCSNPPATMDEMLSCMEQGDICTHSFHGVGHTAAEDDFECLLRAKRRGVIIDTGSAGGVHMNFQHVRSAIARGVVPDTISTDITQYSAFVRGGSYGMTTLMSMMRELGMTEEAVFKAVTSNAAKALGKEQVWGCLKPGGDADIAVIGAKEINVHITDKQGGELHVSKGYDCRLCCVKGQIVHRA